MNQVVTNKPFLKLIRSKDTEELLSNADAFLLLTQIALRAKRTSDFSVNNLQIGEALIGDFEKIGLTRQKYRTALANLQKWNLATIKSTNKGTIAKLANSMIYDINLEEGNHQINQTITIQQPSNNHQITTNKNIRNKEYKKYYSPETEELTDNLKLILEAKLNRKLNTKSWKEEIRKLLEIDLKERQDAIGDVKKAIQEVSTRFGEQYFPVIQSASSFREKFSKIEAAIARNQTTAENGIASLINSIAGFDAVISTKETNEEVKIFCKSPTAISKIFELGEEKKNKIKALFNNKKFEFLS